MQSKRCGRCRTLKAIDQYLVTKKGIESYCNDCRKQAKRESYRRNKVSILAKQKQFKIDNPDIVKERRRKEKSKHKDRYRERSREWSKKNPEKRKEILKRSRERCRGQIREYERNKRATDLNFKLRQNMRARVKLALKAQRAVKAKGTCELIGCTIQELRSHLESQFQHGMTWNNYGTWHIDHIKPLALFDLTDATQQLQAFHWSNMQPLWAHENLLKSDFYLIE